MFVPGTAAAPATSPWLSVLLPVYDVESYLLPCARSLLDQDLRGVELLFLDDASPDGSGELLQALAAEYPGVVRVSRSATNRSVGATRNALLDAARGEWLWFVDPDDLVEPGAVGSLRRIVDRYRPDLVMCDFRAFIDGGGPPDPGDEHVASFRGPSGVLSRDRDALLRGLFRAGKMHVWTKVFRRDVWPPGLRFVSGRAFQDLALVARLSMEVRTWFHTEQIWMAYRQRPGSIQATLNLAKLDHWMEALEGYAAELLRWEVEVGPRTHAAIADYCARSLMRVGELTDRLAGPGCELRHLRNGARWRSACAWSAERLERSYWLRGRLGRAMRWRRWRRRFGL
ncbi:MAG TPA: glycosyltransferase family 2 protein [Anaeromyxobacter sp.]|nr:glycosyltransferase family 2 protein [Anaeromyxobacter sp.]